MASDIHMHTCHSTVGYGTFVSKETVSNFVNMVELDPIDIQYSDQYFVVYTNQVPYMIEGAQGSFPDEPDLYDREGALMEKKFYPNLTDLERFHVVRKTTLPHIFLLFLQNPDVSLQKHQALVSLYNHLDHRTNVFPDQEEIPSMVEQYAKYVWSCFLYPQLYQAIDRLDLELHAAMIGAYSLQTSMASRMCDYSTTT